LRIADIAKRALVDIDAVEASCSHLIGRGNETSCTFALVPTFEVKALGRLTGRDATPVDICVTLINVGAFVGVWRGVGEANFA
jgi:hypothetical protein